MFFFITVEKYCYKGCCYDEMHIIMEGRKMKQHTNIFYYYKKSYIYTS